MNTNCSTLVTCHQRLISTTMKLLRFNRMILRNAAAEAASLAQTPGRLLIQGLLLCAAMQSIAAVSAQEERWFQIEISIFSNENFNPDVERWDVDAQSMLLPANARPLIEMSEVLALSEWDNPATKDPAPDDPATSGPDSSRSDDSVLTNETAEISEPPLIGPPPYQRDNNFKLPDTARDAFVALPPSEHGFTDTNGTLERSPSHRLLFHSSWRQPIRQPSRSSPIIINGGRMFDEKNELQGSVRFRFNPNADRVVLDANIWLTPFNYNEEPVLQMIQSRDMRSNEFHYLDHPAVGIVVLVKPYTPPPLPAAELPANSQDIPQ